MKKNAYMLSVLLILLQVSPACSLPGGSAGKPGGEQQEPLENDAKVIFLHHSTGNGVWKGGVADWFNDYNGENGTQYEVSQRNYPSSPYGWQNYPYDYWQIWVNHAGPQQYKEEDTLELLTPDYQVIVWKHCYPVSELDNPAGEGDITSKQKTIANYKLQYNALKEKMLSFPDTRFIVWTGAVHVEGKITDLQAQNTRDFFNWVKNEWDEPGDNIYIWDFYELETEGGLYLKEEYAQSASNSHPNAAFNQRVAPLFAQRIVNVIQGQGDTTSLTGQ